MIDLDWIAEVPPEEVPGAIARLEEAKALLWVRLTRPTAVPTGRGRILTAAEVAAMMELPLPRVYELARQGLIPHTRLGRQVRFSERALEDAGLV